MVDGWAAFPAIVIVPCILAKSPPLTFPSQRFLEGDSSPAAVFDTTLLLAPFHVRPAGANLRWRRKVPADSSNSRDSEQGSNLRQFLMTGQRLMLPPGSHATLALTKIISSSRSSQHPVPVISFASSTNSQKITTQRAWQCLHLVDALQKFALGVFLDLDPRGTGCLALL